MTKEIIGASFMDVHCHIDDERYDADRDEMVERLARHGGGAITIATDLESSRRSIELSLRYPNVRACVGVYPVGIHERAHEVAELDALFDGPGGENIVCVGECGLDYAQSPTPEEIAEQKRLFLDQCVIAAKRAVPVMIHCREAYADLLELVEQAKQELGDSFRFHMHFFAGDLEVARRVVELGGTLSFTGVITFAAQYDEAVRIVPLDRIMSETDAPYVAPKPHRGTRNEPVYVEHVIARIAELKGLPLEEVSTALRANARRVFGV